MTIEHLIFDGTNIEYEGDDECITSTSSSCCSDEQVLSLFSTSNPCGILSKTYTNEVDLGFRYALFNMDIFFSRDVTRDQVWNLRPSLSIWNVDFQLFNSGRQNGISGLIANQAPYTFRADVRNLTLNYSSFTDGYVYLTSQFYDNDYQKYSSTGLSYSDLITYNSMYDISFDSINIVHNMGGGAGFAMLDWYGSLRLNNWTMTYTYFPYGDVLIHNYQQDMLLLEWTPFFEAFFSQGYPLNE